MDSWKQWRVLCPENRQKERIPTFAINDDLKNIFMSPGTKFDAWSKLARPVHPSQVQSNEGKLIRNPYTRTSVPGWSTIEGLSNEILDIVIRFLLPEKSDLVALGFSSERFWPLVRRHIQLDILQTAAPWAGKKVAFQHSESTDLPPSFREDGFLQEIGRGDGTGSMCEAQRFFWALYDTPSCLKDEHLVWRGAIVEHAGKILIPDGRWKQLEEDMQCLEFFPDSQPWILRNLTTRESVSSAKLGARVMSEDGSRGIEDFNFILLMRTCWSNDPGACANLNIHRGVWAGHRFDIVTQAFHESEVCLEDWRDVTEEVDLEARSLKQRFANRRYY